MTLRNRAEVIMRYDDMFTQPKDKQIQLFCPEGILIKQHLVGPTEGIFFGNIPEYGVNISQNFETTETKIAYILTRF